MKLHYLNNKIASTQHKITVDLVGTGGTGSHMLTNLAILSSTLRSLGRQPIFVRAFDPDKIEPHNVGRQMFSKADVGQYKSEVLVTRANRYFGTEWQSHVSRYEDMDTSANIVISCVDTVIARKAISVKLSSIKNVREYALPMYWLDIGNSRKFGQIVLGTINPGSSVKGSRKNLPTFVKEFKMAKDDPYEPTCSLAASLLRQDLFINKIMATYASNMLWQLLTDYCISYRGLYVNLETMKTQPILL